MRFLPNIFKRDMTRRGRDYENSVQLTMNAEAIRERKLYDLARSHDYDLDELRESVHAEDYDLSDEGPLRKLIDGLNHERK